ncbi:MAG: hypothetical protein MUW56_05655 [Chryseobacterium sp.]|uniref:hypothetical protein n=1 Tax=Chryseobacterium sp. TaxID=1871047 RepID=UPI0025B8C84F|nr:hypothetical protein [Chryseobacterium sp.]MCJ7933120.1 hypothetical protein [Chryseobacterium sp.]
MKIIISFLTIFSICTSAQSLNGTIRDTLLYKESNAPIFVLKLTDILYKNEFHGYTDSNGHFESENLKDGKYRLNIAENNNYIKNEYLLNVKGDTVVNLIAVKYCPYKENKSLVCPVCRRDKNVLPIFYGLTTWKFEKKNRKKYYFGGCEVSGCDPKYYCNTDRVKF